VDYFKRKSEGEFDEYENRGKEIGTQAMQGYKGGVQRGRNGREKGIEGKLKRGE